MPRAYRLEIFVSVFYILPVRKFRLEFVTEDWFRTFLARHIEQIRRIFPHYCKKIFLLRVEQN